MAEPVATEWFRVPMVERIAQAIVQHLAENGRSVFWIELPPIWRDIYRDQARAVIAAMREPNLAMRKVVSFEEAEITWPAMIDAALAPPVPSQTDGDA